MKSEVAVDPAVSTQEPLRPSLEVVPARQVPRVENILDTRGVCYCHCPGQGKHVHQQSQYGGPMR